MPFTCTRQGNVWVKKKTETGKIVSRHATKELCEASIRAVFAQEARQAAKELNITQQVIKDLETSIHRNVIVRKLPPRTFRKQQRNRPLQSGPQGQQGWWITTDAGKRFFISKERVARHRKTVSQVKRATRSLPRWQQGYLGEVRVKNASVRDKIRVGTGQGVVVGRFEPSTGRTILVNSWIAGKLGSRYNIRGIITHEASHAVTARSSLFSPTDKGRPKEERDLIQNFITRGKTEKSAPTAYARHFSITTDTGFHEHFAEWNEAFYTNRSVYNSAKKKFPETERAFRNLQRHYIKGKRQKVVQKAAHDSKIVTTVHLNDKYRIIDDPKQATFTHVHFADGGSAFVWMLTPAQMKEFDDAHGG